RRAEIPAVRAQRLGNEERRQREVFHLVAWRRLPKARAERDAFPLWPLACAAAAALTGRRERIAEVNPHGAILVHDATQFMEHGGQTRDILVRLELAAHFVAVSVDAELPV